MKKLLALLCLTGCLMNLSGCSWMDRAREEENASAALSELIEIRDAFVSELKEAYLAKEGDGLMDWARRSVAHVFQFLARLEGDPGLTEDSALKGRRWMGEDAYTGEYSAEYENFTGTERIFGGTVFTRDIGGTIEISCSIQIDEGEAQLALVSISGEPKTLLSVSGDYTGTIDVNEQTVYTAIIGTNFSGRVVLSVR